MQEIKLKGPKSDIQFVDSFGSGKPTLVMNAYGLDTSGKTRFGMTGPEVIGYIPMDRKTRRTVEIVAKETGKRFLIPKEDFIRQVNPLKLATTSEDSIRTHYKDHVNRVKDAIYALHEHKDVRVICIDFGSQLYQDICFSLYGREMQTIRIGTDVKKDRSEANQMMIDIINIISDKHVIFTAKSRDEWVDNKPTGRTTNEGFRHMGYHANISVEFVNNTKWNPSSNSDESSWHYGIAVRRCQENPSLESGGRKEMTLLDDDITFLNLASLVWPDEDPEEFI